MEKLKTLPADELAEVEHFIDLLRERRNGGGLVHALTRLSEDGFRKVWDNPDDAVYDRL
jgi:hypothetical protein